MDFKQIQELIKIVNKSNIGELSIEDQGFKITIKQKEEAVQNFMAAPQQVYAPQPMAAPQPAMSQPQAGSASTQKAAEPKADNLITIKSPMIGTFYRKAS